MKKTNSPITPVKNPGFAWPRMAIRLSMPIILLAAWAGSSGAQEPALTRTGARKTLVVKAIERTKGTVVNILSERKRNVSPLPTNSDGLQGIGTGIIIDPRGWIVTNHHVVEGFGSLHCRLSDGTTHKVTVIAKDVAVDLALIKITVKNPLPVMPLSTAADLMLGETVIAIGNAMGYEHSVSVGVVSGVKRDMHPEIYHAYNRYKALVQTDAPLNPGNSGGPLININGEMIGVNVAVWPGTDRIGFAIRVDTMIRSVCDMFRARRPTYDGLIVQDRLTNGADGPVRSVFVESVAGKSPADKAGLKAGDVILKVDDYPAACSFDVELALVDCKSGDKVAVVLRRADREERLELVLAARERPAVKSQGPSVPRPAFLPPLRDIRASTERP